MVRVAIFVVALAATIFCAAVNCYTFQIGYPLWRSVGQREFAALHAEYMRRLNWIITVPHVLMFFSCAAVAFVPPRFFDRTEAVVVFFLVASVVFVSAFAAGPVHDRFTRQGRVDDAGMARLIGISAARVVMMLVASAILLHALDAGLLR